MIRRTMRALASAVTLTAIAAGIPWLLAVLAGNPWPGRLAFQLHDERKLLIGALAAICWLAWARFMIVLITDTIEAVRWYRSHPHRDTLKTTSIAAALDDHPMATSGTLGPIIARLIVAILVVLPTLNRTTAARAATPATLTRPVAVTTTLAVHTAASSPTVGSPPAVPVASPVTGGSTTIVVERGDTLRAIARTHLGDESRWREIFETNRDRPQPDGQQLTSPSMIRPGWTLLLPAPASSLAATATLGENSAVLATVSKPGDSLWGLIETARGTVDAATVAEVAAVNDGTPATDGHRFDARTPQLVHLGETFLIPIDLAAAEAPAAPATVEEEEAAGGYVVVAGDTLGSIAVAHYGDRADWTVIWEANNGHTMVDGAVFTDPNLIRPGWTLTIPTPTAPPLPPATSQPPDATTSILATDAPATPPPTVPATAPTTPSATSASSTPPPGSPSAPASSPDGPIASASSTWPPPPTALPSTRNNRGGDVSRPVVERVGHTSRSWLAGLSTTTVLASALLVRYRLLRRRVAARGAANLAAIGLSPAEHETEAALAATADTALTRWANDQLTALIATHGHRGSHVEVVELSDDEIRVWWSPPITDPPTGWSSDRAGRIWTHARDRATEPGRDAGEQAAAVPALVTIGRSDGHDVLVNLEAFGGFAIAGDPIRAEDLIRSIVLELGAGGDLSNAVVHTIGLDVDGAEHLARVRTRAEADTRGHLERLVATNTAMLVDRDQPTMFDLRATAGAEGREVLVITARAGALVDPAGLLALAPGERAVAVVVCGLNDTAAAAMITITADGTAVLSPVGLRLHAAGVPRRTAAQVAILFDHVASALTDPSLPVESEPLVVPTGDVAAPELLVRVFGVPRVDGFPVAVTELQLLTYLACHGRAVNDDILGDRLWGGRYSRRELWEIVARTRASFGSLVEARDDAATTVTIADTVITDVDWCKHLLARAHRTSDDQQAVEILGEALGLLVGEPFAAPGFEWAHLAGDGSYADAVAVIETVCSQLATRAIALDDLDTARTSLTHGIRLLRVNEPLTQQLISLEHHAGDQDAAERVYHRLQSGLVELADSLEATPTTVTTALLEHGQAPRLAVIQRDQPAAPQAGPAPGAVRPRVLLRCFGDVAIDGALVSQAVAVPFVIAAAARPLTDVDVAEITGYNRKTLSTVWTTTNAVLTRENGALTLGDGVWTDYDWMADCVAQVRAAATAGDLAVATGWLQRVFVDLSRLDGHAYERPAGKKDYWRWVDEYPGDVTARQHAEQQLVETALAACQLRDQLAIAEVIAADQVVVIVGNLAQLFPFVPVAAGVRPDEFRTGGECLLLAGHHAAAGRPDLREIVATIAKRLVADGRIEPSDLLADALDH